MRETSWLSALRIGGGKYASGRISLVLALFFTVYPLHAKQDRLGYGPDTFEFDESLEEKWKESDVTLPNYPNDRDLIPVRLSTSFTLKIYLDGKSISRAKDRVARYSLIVESPSGARNVFYDGLRCETREYKTYAIGTANRSFTSVKNPQWQRIPMPEFNAYRDYLYRHYICDGHASARTPGELVQILKYQP